jgi:hypothetical protein
MHFSIPLALTYFLVAPIGCATVGSSSGITLHVVNETCRTGQCAPLQVLGFPGNQPSMQGHPWILELGVVETPEACLVLPPRATFSVSHAGSGEVETYDWSIQEPLSVGTRVSGQSAVAVGPSTFPFVPAQQAGWSIALPGGELVSAAVPCVR